MRGKLYKRDCVQLLPSHLPFHNSMDYTPAKLHDSGDEKRSMWEIGGGRHRCVHVI